MTGKGAARQGEVELEAGRALKATGSMFAAKSRRKQLTYALSYGGCLLRNQAAATVINRLAFASFHRQTLP
jgi:hypothetical protein